MTSSGNEAHYRVLPPVFCWTKFGSEAGERPEAIFQRKELERSMNGGVFLWGIGQSIRPSLGMLSAVESPQVLFSPMKSAPAKKDSEPGKLALWRQAVAPDGREFQIPEYSIVTSRYDHIVPKASHFALVCRKTDSLCARSDFVEVRAADLRNLSSGSALGASQVTAAVRIVSEGAPGSTAYPVSMHADLVYPYMVRLVSPVIVPDSLRARLMGDDMLRALSELADLKSHRSVAVAGDQLTLV